MITNKEVDAAIQDLQKIKFIEDSLYLYLRHVRDRKKYCFLQEDFESAFQLMRVELETMKYILLINHCN